MKKIENDITVNNINTEVYPVYRLTLKKSEKFFGPGISELLHLIEQNKSIQAACDIMGMSYSKAWNIIRRVERELGYKMLDTKTGGSGGGLSILSEKGKKFLDNYDKMINELNTLTEKVFKKYYED